MHLSFQGVLEAPHVEHLNCENFVDDYFETLCCLVGFFLVSWRIIESTLLTDESIADAVVARISPPLTDDGRRPSSHSFDIALIVHFEDNSLKPSQYNPALSSE